MSSFLFFFNDTATTEIYTLSLHDALPISIDMMELCLRHPNELVRVSAAAAYSEHSSELDRLVRILEAGTRDRKSTRLNSSHSQISYAVFCLKKKKQLQSRSLRLSQEPIVD